MNFEKYFPPQRGYIAPPTGAGTVAGAVAGWVAGREVGGVVPAA